MQYQIVIQLTDITRYYNWLQEVIW